MRNSYVGIPSSVVKGHPEKSQAMGGGGAIVGFWLVRRLGVVKGRRLLLGIVGPCLLPWCGERGIRVRGS